MFIVTDNSKLNPRRLKLDTGDSAVFTCKSNRDVKWSFNSNDLPYNFVHGSMGDSTTVELPQFELLNAGYYYCYGYDQNKD